MAYGTYDKYVIDGGVLPANMANAANANGSPAAVLAYPVKEPITVTRFGFYPVANITYGATPTYGILTLYRYPQGANTNKIALASISMGGPGSVANTTWVPTVGKVYYVDVWNWPMKANFGPNDPYTGIWFKGMADFDAGDTVAVEITTQGNSNAGTFQPYFTWNPRAEEQFNQPCLVNLTPPAANVQDPLNPEYTPPVGNTPVVTPTGPYPTPANQPGV
jgi:hypothetical protein